MLDECDAGTMRGIRDRAILALGFAGAFRRSELVALTVADLTEVPDGYRALIRRSKTDQTGGALSRCRSAPPSGCSRLHRICDAIAYRPWLISSLRQTPFAALAPNPSVAFLATRRRRRSRAGSLRRWRGFAGLSVAAGGGFLRLDGNEIAGHGGVEGHEGVEH
jgi:integrase